MPDVIFEHVVSWDNLWLAFREAARGKRRKTSAAAFEVQLADNLIALQDELRAKTYRPGAYVHFFIHEPKRRKISAAPFRDRVVHHALCNLIEPLFDRLFIADSYANRVGKGTHAALDRLQAFSQRYRFALRADVVQHFPSLDHAVLREQDRPRHPRRRHAVAGGRHPRQRGRRAGRRVHAGVFPRRRPVRHPSPARSAHRQPDLAILVERVPERLRLVRQARVGLRQPTCAMWTTSPYSATTSASCGPGSAPSSDGWPPSA